MIAGGTASCPEFSSFQHAFGVAPSNSSDTGIEQPMLPPVPVLLLVAVLLLVDVLEVDDVVVVVLPVEPPLPPPPTLVESV